MYGTRTTSAMTASGGTGLLSASTDLWVVFAVITVLFALSALWQLVRPAPAHRP